MNATSLTLGFVPLVDAAPLLVAQALGFAGEEGLDLTLVPAPSWSSLRDMLSSGQVVAAQMLAPVPIATAMGLGGAATQLEALMVLNLNGNTVGVSRDLAARMRAGGFAFDFADARAAGLALLGAGPGLRVGVPFAFSMHRELIHYWLGSLGLPLPTGLEICTVPPPRMAEALAAGEIDAFCVGEPRGSVAVETGAGELILPGSAIWAAAPEKVLAARAGWAEAEPDRAGPADARNLAGGPVAGTSVQSQRGRGPAFGAGTAGRWIGSDRTGPDRTAGHLCGRHRAAGAGNDRVPCRGRQFSVAQSGGVDRRAAGVASRAGPRAGRFRSPLGLPQRPLPFASARNRRGFARRFGQAGGVVVGPHGGPVSTGSADSASKPFL